MRMGAEVLDRRRCVSDLAGENGVGCLGQPRDKSAGGCTEHTFVKTRGMVGRNRTPAAGPHQPVARVDQASSLVLIRSTTAVVNSEVAAPPPRSGVLVPDAIVSSADS